MLLKQETERYSVQISLNEIGKKGQEKLLSSRVLIIGVGGLGSPAALYLASAGVGTVGIADSDTVELSNLQRQIIHSTADLGREKVSSAKETMLAINPKITVNTYNEFINSDNIAAIIKDYDFILDCTDNFKSKFLINDACVKEEKPFCHAGILGFQGEIMTYIPGDGPCYRCLFREPPKDKQTGVIGAVAGVIGCMQAIEAIKFITGAGKPLTNKLLMYDALRNEFNTVNIKKDKTCPVCSNHLLNS